MFNSVYNYIFGYIEIECKNKNCKRKFYVHKSHIGLKTNMNIMCSNSCIYNSKS